MFYLDLYVKSLNHKADIIHTEDNSVIMRPLAIYPYEYLLSWSFDDSGSKEVEILGDKLLNLGFIQTNLNDMMFKGVPGNSYCYFREKLDNTNELIYRMFEK